jgi:myosin-1
MDILELDTDEVSAVLGLVASVLKLGNVTFLPSNNIDGTEGCSVTNDYGESIIYASDRSESI